MTSATNHTVVGFFLNRQSAETAINDLVSHGFERDHISVVASDARPTDAPNLGPLPGTGSTSDTGEKTAIGTMAGVILGMAALAIPGVGPILAAGPLAMALTGAAAGAATGGLIGLMTDDGVPEPDAQRYQKAISSGRVMVTIKAPSERADHAADLLDRNGAVDVDEPAATTSTVRAPKLDEGSSLVAKQRERERRVSVHPGITGSGTTPHA